MARSRAEFTPSLAPFVACDDAVAVLMNGALLRCAAVFDDVDGVECVECLACKTHNNTSLFLSCDAGDILTN